MAERSHQRPAEEQDKASHRLHRAMVLAEAMTAGELTLESLAKAASLSVFHLSRNFYHVAGCSFSEYRRRRRLSEGKRMVLETSLSVKEIAVFLGYSRYDLFTRVFKEATGYTPTSYREAFWRLHRTPPRLKFSPRFGFFRKKSV